MRTISSTIDSNGRLEFGEGWGFMIEAGQPPAGAAGFNSGNRPGRFPAQVRPGDESPLTVPNGGSRYFDKPKPLAIVNGVQGDTYTVTLFESPTEAAQPSGQKTRASVPLIAAGTAIQTANPTNNDGFEINPGTLGFNAYLAGVARTITIWQKSFSGNWYATGQTIDMTVDSLVDYYDVKSPAARVCLVASGAGATLELEAVQEVG